jgi:hypothetical protein
MNYLQNLLYQNPSNQNYDSALASLAQSQNTTSTQSPAAGIKRNAESPSIIPNVSRQDMLQWGLKMMAEGGKPNGASVLSNAGQAGLDVMASNATEADKAQKLAEFQALQDVKMLMLNQQAQEKQAALEQRRQAAQDMNNYRDMSLQLQRDSLAQRAFDAAEGRKARGDDNDPIVKAAKKIKAYEDAGLYDQAESLRATLAPPAPTQSTPQSSASDGGLWNSFKNWASGKESTSARNNLPPLK